MSTPTAPTLDSGFVDVPTSATDVPTATATSYLMGGNFCNTTDASITLTITDTAGSCVSSVREIAAHGGWEPSWGYLPMNGVLWTASATGLTGKLWGYNEWPF